MEIVEFFIDTHNPAAYNYVMSIINSYASSDVDKKYAMRLMRDLDEGDGVHYMFLKGTWHSYKLFLNVGQNDGSEKYRYSLSHYEE